MFLSVSYIRRRMWRAEILKSQLYSYFIWEIKKWADFWEFLRKWLHPCSCARWGGCCCIVLKSQLFLKITRLNDKRTVFWEFLKMLLCMCFRARYGGYRCINQKFSKISSVAILYSIFGRELTFEIFSQKLLRPCSHARCGSFQCTPPKRERW